MQLFLLHFAGGNCYSYEFLRKLIPPYIEFIPLELPGRGKRYDEKLVYNKRLAIRDYLSQIQQHRNQDPYMIFGHSMGATLGLPIAKAMEKKGDAPLALIVSGNAGPGFEKNNQKDFEGPRYLLPEQLFKNELSKLGGISDEILNNKELFEFFAPIIRADFEVLEKKNNIKPRPLHRTSIFALMGNEEEDYLGISNWKKFTRGIFQCKILKGNHFFIHKHAQVISEIITKTISKSAINV